MAKTTSMNRSSILTASHWPRLALIAAGVCGAVLTVPGSIATATAAGPGTAIVAGPYAQNAGFATPTMVITKGSDASLVNADPLSPHSVVSTKTHRVKVGRRYVRKPLFATNVVGSGTVVTIAGTSGLKPGSYSFVCSLHGGMKGTLIVE